MYIHTCLHVQHKFQGARLLSEVLSHCHSNCFHPQSPLSRWKSILCVRQCWDTYIYVCMCVITQLFAYPLCYCRKFFFRSIWQAVKSTCRATSQCATRLVCCLLYLPLCFKCVCIFSVFNSDNSYISIYFPLCDIAANNNNKNNTIRISCYPFCSFYTLNKAYYLQRIYVNQFLNLGMSI